MNVGEDGTAVDKEGLIRTRPLTGDVRVMKRGEEKKQAAVP